MVNIIDHFRIFRFSFISFSLVCHFLHFNTVRKQFWIVWHFYHPHNTIHTDKDIEHPIYTGIRSTSASIPSLLPFYSRCINSAFWNGFYWMENKNTLPIFIINIWFSLISWWCPPFWIDIYFQWDFFIVIIIPYLWPYYLSDCKSRRSETKNFPTNWRKSNILWNDLTLFCWFENHWIFKFRTNIWSIKIELE